MFYTFLCFNDLVPDPDTRSLVASVSCLFAGAHIMVNIMIVCKQNFKAVNLSCKRRRWLKKEKQRIREK